MCAADLGLLVVEESQRAINTIGFLLFNCTNLQPSLMSLQMMATDFSFSLEIFTKPNLPCFQS